jgi:hypothetical protein
MKRQIAGTIRYIATTFASPCYRVPLPQYAREGYLLQLELNDISVLFLPTWDQSQELSCVHRNEKIAFHCPIQSLVIGLC